MKSIALGLLASTALFLAGCASPKNSISGMQLGMTPVEVLDIMGEPDVIRASKVYNDGQISTVWEYNPPIFEINPKSFWITFQNERVVQWGEPGDWAGKSGKTVPVEDYKPTTGR